MSLLKFAPSSLKRFLLKPAQLVSVSIIMVIGGCNAETISSAIPDNVNTKTLTQNTDSQSNHEDIQALIDSYAENRGFTGSVMVAKGEDILSKSSFGEADVEWGVPNSPTTKYRIGSLTKPMTATLIMTLVEDGTLSLDGSLGEYVPDLDV